MAPRDWAPALTATRTGGGLVARTDGGFLLAVPGGARHYTNAQVDDTAGRARRDFLHRPPLRLTLRARFSHDARELVGTAGFGFWNDPFGMSGTWPPTLPAAAWFFFASAPSNMPLAAGVPGRGFKAATLETRRALPLLPLAPVAPLALRVASLERAMWPFVQRAAAIHERAVWVDLRAWHTWEIDWRATGLRFAVDGAPLLESDQAPRGPLGLVIWIDTQFLIATPQGRLAWGAMPAPHAQWMEVDALRVERL